MFTPTSRYWNWVLTSELTMAVAAPVWYDPVAIGIRSPIFSVASCPSEARMRGFCNILVELLVSSRFACACPIDTAKLVPFRCAKLFSVSPLLLLLLLLFVLPPVVDPPLLLLVSLKFDA